MKPYYQDNHIRIFNKDCRSMDELPDESVQCVVTSPPYWSLRKYAGNQDLIWGDNHCEHQWGDKLIVKRGHSGDKTTLVGTQTAQLSKSANNQGAFCSLCGAVKSAFGLESSPEEYVQHTIQILREIRRVLRPDGVCFWNIGDSYAGSGSPRGDFRNGKGGDEYLRPYNRKGGVLKPKDLCLVPFRIAIAAQEDGWWVRSVIIWSKPNPMPESVTDRPTESHEYILMLTKSGTTQYWTHRDHEGTRTQPEPDYRWINQKTKEEITTKPEGWTPKNKMGWDRVNLWQGHDYYWDADAVREPYSPTERWGGEIYKGSVKKGTHGEDAGLDRLRSCFPNAGRNIRTVWEFNGDDEQGGNFYKVLQGCPIHSPLLHPDILKMLHNDEPQDCLLTHTLDRYNCLVPVLSSSLSSKIFHTSGDAHLSKMGYHHHETLLWQIAESIGDNKMLALCYPGGGHLSYPETTARTKHIETSDGLLACSSDYSRQSDELIATLRNKEIRRIVSLIATNDSVFLQCPDRTAHTLQSLGCICSYQCNNISHFPLSSVWSFSTQPFKEAHFAVFPEKLPEICIKAATPEVGCCSKCGAPWARVVERPDMRQRPLRTLAKQDGQRIHSGFDGYPQSAGQEWQKWRGEHPDKTIGWQPTCKCNTARVPSLVLDPLMGAGTTLLVAKELNRYAEGYELSEEYCQLTVERCRQQVLV